MEYKLIIWMRNQPDECPVPPKYTGYELAVSGPDAVDAEKIPAELYLTMPDIAYKLELTLTPDSPTDFIRKQIMKYAISLASGFEGAVENLQPGMGEDRFTYCADIFDFPPVTEYTEKMYISLWYPKSIHLTAHIKEISDIFSDCFPYCLPEKYGDSEPPQKDLAHDGGIEGFNEFVLGCEKVPVIYSKLPVTHVFIEDAEKYAPIGSKTASCIRIETISAMYDEPEWQYASKRLLKKLALVGKDSDGKGGAFFGQIVRGKTQVSSWWWKGIPIELGNACIISKPYTELIPDCEKGLKISDGTVYFEEPDGPIIDKRYLSVERKKKLFRKYPAADLFTDAEIIPDEIFRNE